MRKINPTHLIIALVVLTAIWLVARYAGAERRRSNVRTELIALDTAQVDELHITRKADAKPLVLKRLDKGKWKVGPENEAAFDADATAVQQALAVLSKVTAQRMLSRKKEKWTEYEVTDSALLVKAFRQGKTLAAIRIGKLTFPASGSAYTAVRLDNETETYAVQGYLSTNLGRSLTDWRDKTFMRLKPEKVDKIVFEYPADSAFTLTKADSVWKTGDKTAAPDRVERYLNQFRSKNLSAFADDFIATGSPLYRIRFEGMGAELERVEIWQKPDGTYVLRGIHLPVFFSDQGSAIIKDLLKPRKYFTD
jgi:hypothetical protein